MSKKSGTTRQEMHDRIIAKAAVDAAFRARLLAAPKKAIQDEFNIRLPNSFSLKVLEESPSSAYLVLPCVPKSDKPGSTPLSDAELEAVAGGGWCAVTSSAFESNPDGDTSWRCTCL